MVAGWTLIGRILVVLVLVFYSISIGLIDNGILRSETCCGDDDMCWEVIYLESEAFYDSVTGLRTRYILFVLFLFLGCLLRWLESDWIRPVIVFSVYEACLIVALLTADSAIRSFGDSPLAGEGGNLLQSYTENRYMGENTHCKVEPGTISLNVTCSWLGLLLGVALFHIACLNLPKEGLWERGIVNFGYVHDMRSLGVKADGGVVDEDEEDVI